MFDKNLSGVADADGTNACDGWCCDDCEDPNCRTDVWVE